jgi:hypothetical protein
VISSKSNSNLVRIIIPTTFTYYNEFLSKEDNWWVSPNNL